MQRDARSYDQVTVYSCVRAMAARRGVIAVAPPVFDAAAQTVSEQVSTARGYATEAAQCLALDRADHVTVIVRELPRACHVWLGEAERRVGKGFSAVAAEGYFFLTRLFIGKNIAGREERDAVDASRVLDEY